MTGCEAQADALRCYNYISKSTRMTMSMTGWLSNLLYQVLCCTFFSGSSLVMFKLWAKSQVSTHVVLFLQCPLVLAFSFQASDQPANQPLDISGEHSDILAWAPSFLRTKHGTSALSEMLSIGRISCHHCPSEPSMSRAVTQLSIFICTHTAALPMYKSSSDFVLR